MNKQRFTKVLREPGKLKDELDELQELQHEYPYAQSVHVLVALAHKQIKTNEAANALNYAAIYVADRQNLKQLIDKGVDSNLTTYNQTKTQAINKEREENKRIADEQVKEEEKSSIKATESPTPTTATSEIKETESSVETEKTSVKKETVEIPKKGRYVFTHSQDDQNTEGERMRNDLIMRLENLQASKREWGSEKQEDIPVEKPKTLPEAPKSKKISGKETSAKEKKIKPAKKSAENKEKKNPKPKTKSKKAEVEEADKIKKQQELISKFIEKSPSLKSKANKPPIISAEQEDLSIPSTSFSDNLISENLAEILISQNKLDKAIDIYKKLIWKFPQKKAYFAAQIEELNKKKG